MTALLELTTPNRTMDDAFADFVRTNTRTLTRTAYLLTGSVSAAEELVQDTLVSLFPKWSKVMSADAPVAYVRRSVANQFYNQRRRLGREVLTDEVPERPNGRGIEQALTEHDEMWTLLATLGQRQRAALVLRYYEGFSDAEIAETLGCQLGTVRSLISRGLATLRKSMPATPPTHS